MGKTPRRSSFACCALALAIRVRVRRGRARFILVRIADQMTHFVNWSGFRWGSEWGCRGHAAVRLDRMEAQDWMSRLRRGERVTIRQVTNS
ncbi:hypothetical protein GCM10010844_15380 [Deinococcus radiotolerans]|uniref:Uncharacterized protein n=1 Tax=Deinococcus radiotolerans TaxID=1309407 RepID=A0ABQ2FHS5_9DEIO|nr:hypothetical protein GCM10010844_15380 [Deinococcus radiotolerans]